MGKKSRIKKSRQLSQVDQSKKTVDVQQSKAEKILLWIIQIGVYLSLFTPLIVSVDFFFPFVGPKSLFFMGLTEIIVASWICLMLVSRRYKPTFNALVLSLILLFFTNLVAAIFGANWSYSFWSKFERMTGILMWLHLVGFFLAVSSVFKKDSQWRRIFFVSICVAIIASLMSLFNAGGSGRGGATIGNTSFLGTYLLFNVFLAIYLFFRTKQIACKIFYGAVVILIPITVYLATARAAILAILGGFVLLGFCWLAFEPRKKWIRITGKVLLILLVASFIATAVLLIFPNSPVQKLFIKSATKARLVVWQDAWAGIKERPILGWGPENFEFAFTEHFNPCMFLSECGGEVWFDRTHNIIFDTLITSGFVGLAAYFALFLIAFFLLLKGYFQKRIGFWTSFIPVVALIAYSVQNLTVFDMISSYLMLFLFLSFIFVKSELNLTQAENTLKQNSGFGAKRKWPFALIAVAFFLCFSIFVFQPAKADYYVIGSLKAESFQERLVYYQKALEASPLGKYQIREFFGQTTQNTIASNIEVIAKDPQKVEAAKEEVDFVIGELEKTAQEAPLDYKSVLRISQLTNVAAQLDIQRLAIADKYNQEALKLSPTNQQTYWAIAQTKVYERKYDEAFAAAQKAIDLEPKWLQSYKIAYQVAQFSQDFEKQWQIIDQAKAIDPAWEKEVQGTNE